MGHTQSVAALRSIRIGLVRAKGAERGGRKSAKYWTTFYLNELVENSECNLVLSLSRGAFARGRPLLAFLLLLLLPTVPVGSLPSASPPSCVLPLPSLAANAAAAAAVAAADFCCRSASSRSSRSAST